MNVGFRKPMTVGEFLAWEERQELRYEFDGLRPVATIGGTIAHDLITFNIRKRMPEIEVEVPIDVFYTDLDHASSRGAADAAAP
jgi:hypothetical protein